MTDPSLIFISYHFSGLQYEYVTCGSVIKLINARLGVRLHSHDVKYGSGSGQQVIMSTQSESAHVGPTQYQN